MTKPPRITGAGDLFALETTLDALRDSAAGCTACHLHRNATQTVFGEGPEDAAVLLVGEQPGDMEDLAGRPFVGPAGKLLDRWPRRSRHRSCEDLRDECRQTLQMGAARHPAHPQQAGGCRDRSLLALARGRNRRREAARRRRAGSDSGPGVVWKSVSRN